jgi:hypothetical protein
VSNEAEAASGGTAAPLIALDTGGYDPKHRELKVPSTTRIPQSVISLDSGHP